MTASALRVGIVVEQVWQPIPGGSGTYVVELSRALRARADVTPVGISAWHREAVSPDWDPGIPVRRSLLPRRALYAAWQRLGRPRVDRADGALDVCHATTWAVPPTRRALVVTVHDLAFLDGPQLFTQHGNAFFRRALDTVRRRADAVIVPSHATADACVAAGIDVTRLHVVPHGVEVPRPSRDAIADTHLRHAVTRPYIMWAGTVEPRKNVGTLIQAYDELARETDAPDLLLVGPAGWGSLPHIPAHLRDRVRLTGRVSRMDLHALYAGASAFVYPSLSEGFGLPVLEAMAHGLPVVTSRNTACDEVLGGAGYSVDPLDASQIAHALETALGPDGALRAALGRERSATFRWDRSAELTVQAYRAALESRSS